jgi:ribosomal protein L14E/L6E/L27E
VTRLFDRLPDRGFEVGDAVISMAGHDVGRVYVIVNVEREYLFLVDGAYRTLMRPKKKKNKHVRGLGVRIAGEKLRSLDGLKVEAEKNAKIRTWLEDALAGGLRE